MRTWTIIQECIGAAYCHRYT